MEWVGDEIAVKYNDPLGRPMDNAIRLGLNISGIPITHITDYQIQQQAEDLNCGAMATNNLVRMAIDEPIMKTEEALSLAPEIRRNNAADVARFINYEKADVVAKNMEAERLLGARESSNPNSTPIPGIEDLDQENEMNPFSLNKEGFPLGDSYHNWLPLQNQDYGIDEEAIYQKLIDEEEKQGEGERPKIHAPNDFIPSDRQRLVAEISNLKDRMNNVNDSGTLLTLREIYNKKYADLMAMDKTDIFKLPETSQKQQQIDKIEKELNLLPLLRSPEEEERYRQLIGEFKNLKINDTVLSPEEEARSRKGLADAQKFLDEKQDKKIEDLIYAPGAPLTEVEHHTSDEDADKWIKEEEERRRAWKKIAAKTNYTQELQRLIKEKSIAPPPNLPEGLTENDVIEELKNFAVSNPRQKLIHKQRMDTDPYYASEYTKKYLPKKHEAIEDPTVAAEINRLHNPKTYERQKREAEELEKLKKDVDFLLGGTGRQYEKAEVLHKYELPETRVSPAAIINSSDGRAAMKRMAKRMAEKNNPNYGQGAYKNQWGGSFSGNYGQPLSSPFSSQRRANPLEFFARDKFNPEYYAPPVAVN